MARAKKLPSGNWRVQVFLGTDENGKNIMKSITAPSKREAEFQAAEMKLKWDRERDLETMTLRDACVKYIEYKKKRREYTTISGYNIILDNGFGDLMDIPVKSITTRMLQDSIDKEAQRECNRKPGVKISNKTLKNEFGFIRSVLRYHKIDVINGFVAEYPKSDDKGIRELPRPVTIYNAVLQTGDDELLLAVLLAMWLSYSQSEIKGLRMSSVSDDGEFITINETVTMVNGKTIRKKRGKVQTRLRRHRLPQIIKDLINSTCKGKVADDPIIDLNRNQMYKRFIRALERNAGITGISFHDLRHISATSAALAGVSDKMLEQYGGWSDGSSVLQSVYKETLAGEREQADKLINEFFENELGISENKKEG